MWWNTFRQENVGADRRIRANHSVAAHDRGSGVNADTVFDRGVAFFPTQRLSGPKRARDERYALVKFHVRPDLRRLANDHSSAMIDEEMRADLRTWMNIDSGAAVCPLCHDAGNQRNLSVEQVRHSINGDRLQRRISEDDFLVSRSSRVPFVSGVDIRPKRAAYRWQLPEKFRQYFFGFCFCCFIRGNFAEASANFSFES